MPNRGGRSVFISYARKDGAELAQRLQRDLTAKGFDVWLDTPRIRGGAGWTDEIERANRNALDLIHGAIRLSMNVIDKHPEQFVSQVAGGCWCIEASPSSINFPRGS